MVGNWIGVSFQNDLSVIGVVVESVSTNFDEEESIPVQPEKDPSRTKGITNPTLLYDTA